MCLLHKDAVAGHDSPVERKPRLGAIPVGEFTNCMVVRAENSGGPAVADGGFRVLQIRQSEYRFSSALCVLFFPCRHFCRQPHRHGAVQIGGGLPRCLSELRQAAVARPLTAFDPKGQLVASSSTPVDALLGFVTSIRNYLGMRSFSSSSKLERRRLDSTT